MEEKINNNSGNWICICIKLTKDARCLKALDTFGNCQRPVFSLGVSQHMDEPTNL